MDLGFDNVALRRQCEISPARVLVVPDGTHGRWRRPTLSRISCCRVCLRTGKVTASTMTHALVDEAWLLLHTQGEP